MMAHSVRPFSSVEATQDRSRGRGGRGGGGGGVGFLLLSFHLLKKLIISENCHKSYKTQHII